jgi:hypothetical protein
MEYTGHSDWELICMLSVEGKTAEQLADKSVASRPGTSGSQGSLVAV